jgi:septal ring factor EnvC (AmiA/AmiB activator)
MSEIINKKYLDLSGLATYDSLIKKYIDNGDAALSAAIAALSAKIGSLEFEGSDDKSIADSISDIYSSIVEIISAQESLEAKDEELAIRIQKVADDLQFVTGGDSENEATIGEINATLVQVKNDLAEIRTIAEQAQADATYAKDAVDVLNGEGEGSVKKIAEDAAAAAVAAVIDGAESDFDTLREVAEWIAADKEGSAALQSTVSSHTESITTLTGDLTELEAKVDEDIANLTTHMSDAATKIAEVDGRLEALEAFEETHTSIDVSDIEGLFAKE